MRLEIVWELEFEVEPTDVTELLQSHDKISSNERRKWFLDMESTPAEEAVKIVEITRDLKYYLYLVN